MEKHNFNTGAIKDKRDRRDYKYKDAVLALGLAPFDWNEGYDVEVVIGKKLDVKDQNGSGSCFKGDVPVLSEGFLYKAISDIKIGDLVFTHNGNLKRVIKVFKRKWQGTTKTVKIWGDFREIECTKEHPFFAIKKPKVNRYINKNGKTGWLKNEELLRKEVPQFYTIEELKTGDWVAVPFNNKEEDKTIFSYEKDPDFLWVLGLYMAEGSIDKYGVAFSLHRKEFEWYEKIKRIMEKYGANVTYSFRGENGLVIKIFGKKWSGVFEELGGKLCDKKKINTRLIFLNPTLQMNIFNGVHDGDGTEHRGQKVIKSTSFDLLNQLRIILLRNGIYSSFCKEKKYDGKKQAYTLSISQKERYSFVRDNYCFVQIKNIKHNKNYDGGHVYNLEVEDDNSYQVNGIAVHNCGGQAWSYYGQVLDPDHEQKSAKFIYAHTFVPPAGSSGRTNCKLVIDKGWGSEELTPSYDDGKPPKEPFMQRKSDITQEAYQKALLDKALSYANVQINIDAIAQAIRDNKGCVIGISGKDNGTWRSAFPKPPKDVIQAWNHWVFCGKAKTMNGKRYIGFINSWGEKTGQNGWQWISEDYVQYPFVWSAWTLVYDFPKFRFTKYMMYGSFGNEVKELQKRLGVIQTGFFGPLTYKAVKEYQQKKGLKVDGVVGPSTRALLNQ